MEGKLTVYVLSDSLGETGEQLSKAALSQFNSGKYEVRKFPYIISKDQILEIFEEANNEPSVVVYTIVIDGLRSFIERKGMELYIPTVDLMTPTLEAIENNK